MVQLLPQKVSVLKKFIEYPQPPSKRTTLKPKSCGRVLTSADCMKKMEEKEQQKAEKAKKKADNAKKREERAKVKLSNMQKQAPAPTSAHGEYIVLRFLTTIYFILFCTSMQIRELVKLEPANTKKPETWYSVRVAKSGFIMFVLECLLSL